MITTQRISQQGFMITTQRLWGQNKIVFLSRKKLWTASHERPFRCLDVQCCTTRTKLNASSEANIKCLHNSFWVLQTSTRPKLYFQEKESGSYGWVGAGVGMRGSPLVWRHTCVIADFIKVFLSFYWDIWKQSNK